MIVLDTHVWVFWVDGGANLPGAYKQVVAEGVKDGLGISAFSCWEVAKLVQLGRLVLACSVDDWMAQATSYPGIRLLELTPQIAIESTRMPRPFHKDPADQIIVATARVLDCPLVTLDDQIRKYEHVKLVP